MEVFHQRSRGSWMCLGKGSMRAETSRERIIIFGRYPVPGKVKTRLIPVLGPAGAADLQRELTEATLRTTKSFAVLTKREAVFCFDGGSRDKILKWLGNEILLCQQERGNLGMRMHTAFLRAFQDGCTRVVLVGTDIPGLRKHHLQEAFEMLGEKDVVFGPSTDGGYWLVGMNQPLNIFEGISWGTDTVLDQSLKEVRKRNLLYHLLKPLKDVDTIEDLRQWNAGPEWCRPYLSVIIPALNEERSLERTIKAAHDEDAEIIVVDGGSSDRTVTIAEDAGAKVIMTRKGRALQQNAGAASARGNVLLFLHADTLVPRHYVGHVFETLLPKRTAAGAFQFKTDSRVPLIRIVEWMTNVRSRFLQLPYGDQALFLKKDLFHSLGGFPEVAIAEDLLLIRSLQKHGRIRIAQAEAITSGRRWERLGVIRTTLINWIIMAGCYLGVSPDTLAPLYRMPREVAERQSPISAM